MKSLSGNVSTWMLFFLAFLGIGLIFGIENSTKIVLVPVSEEDIVKNQKIQSSLLDVEDSDLIYVKKYNVTLTIIFLIFYLLMIFALTRVDLRYYIFHRKGVMRNEKN